mgnify:CR=1 FL=1
MASDNGKSFLDKFAEVSAKVGNQVHLRSLRDAFATITPLYILAGIAVLINNVVFPLFPLDAAGLANLQTWGSAITLGTLNVSAIILAGLIGYSLAKNKRFDNPLACVVVAISAFVIMMPQQITASLAATSPLLTDKITSAEVTGALSTANTGTNCSRLLSSPCFPSRSSSRFLASRSSRLSWARACLPRSQTPSTS